MTEGSRAPGMEHRWDFGQHGLDHAIYAPVGNIQVSHDGLVLADANDAKGFIGIKSRFGLEGDFDITFAYELRTNLSPKPSELSGPSVYLFTSGPRAAVEFGCFWMADGRHGCSVFIKVPFEGQVKKSVRRFRVDIHSGNLRLRRRSNELFFEVADAASPNDYRTLMHTPFNKQYIPGFRIAVKPHGAAQSLDVIVKDLTVRADRFVPSETVLRRQHLSFQWGIVRVLLIAVVGCTWVFRNLRSGVSMAD